MIGGAKADVTLELAGSLGGVAEDWLAGRAWSSPAEGAVSDVERNGWGRRTVSFR